MNIDIAPTTIIAMDYEQAWLYCITLSYNGHKDWRMPTADEYYHTDISAGSFDEDDEYEGLIAIVCPVRTICSKSDQ